LCRGYELDEADFEKSRKKLSKGNGAYGVSRDELNSAIAGGS
jgi:hypothetical protein